MYTADGASISIQFGKAVQRRDRLCVFAENGTGPTENCAPQPASAFERVCPDSPQLGMSGPLSGVNNYDHPGRDLHSRDADECGDVAAGGQERSGRCGEDTYFLHMLDSKPESCPDLSGTWVQYAPSSTQGQFARKMKSGV